MVFLSGKNSIFHISSIVLLCFGSVSCYPITETEHKLKSSDEKRYPNGTVVGKYSYTDSEGYPIQVKYFADDSSYGVELKSVKIVPSSTLAPQTLQTFRLPVSDTLGSDFYNPTNIKYNINDPFEVLNEYKAKNTFKDLKTSPDYEIYFHNELQAPKKCGKDKVRVYFDKDKRKIRETTHELDDAAKICSRF